MTFTNAPATATEFDMLDCEICAEVGCNGCTDPGVTITVGQALGMVVMIPLLLLAGAGSALLRALVSVAAWLARTV